MAMVRASGSARSERCPDTEDTLTDEDAAMTLTRRADEVARLGNEVYERDIRAQVEAEHHGEIIAIDVESGCWDSARRRRRRGRSSTGNTPG